MKRAFKLLAFLICLTNAAKQSTVPESYENVKTNEATDKEPTPFISDCEEPGKPDSKENHSNDEQNMDNFVEPQPKSIENSQQQADNNSEQYNSKENEENQNQHNSGENNLQNEELYQTSENSRSKENVLEPSFEETNSKDKENFPIYNFDPTADQKCEEYPYQPDFAENEEGSSHPNSKENHSKIRENPAIYEENDSNSKERFRNENSNENHGPDPISDQKCEEYSPQPNIEESGEIPPNSKENHSKSKENSLQPNSEENSSKNKENFSNHSESKEKSHESNSKENHSKTKKPLKNENVPSANVSKENHSKSKESSHYISSKENNSKSKENNPKSKDASNESTSKENDSKAGKHNSNENNSKSANTSDKNHSKRKENSDHSGSKENHSKSKEILHQSNSKENTSKTEKHNSNENNSKSDNGSINSHSDENHSNSKENSNHPSSKENHSKSKEISKENSKEQNDIETCMLIKCSSVYDPICARNKNCFRTFPNECILDQLNCELKQSDRFKKVYCGACVNEKLCYDDYNLICSDENISVCGYNGNCYQTFPGICHLNQENCKNKGNVFSLSGYVECEKFEGFRKICGKHSMCPKTCDENFKSVVCGFNGKKYVTFANPCLMGKANCDEKRNYIVISREPCPN